MSVLHSKSGRSKTKLSWFIAIVLFLVVVSEIECIKFGRKQQSNNKLSKPEDKAEIKTANNDQTSQQKKQQSQPKIQEKAQKDITDPLSNKKSEKTQQTKTQISTQPKIDTPQQKPTITKQLHNAVDSLFGISNSPKKQQEEQKALPITGLTVIPQKRSTPATTGPLTISTTPNTTPDQETKNKEHILEKLFEDLKGQNVKPTEEKKQNEQTSPQIQKLTPSIAEDTNKLSQTIPITSQNVPQEQSKTNQKDEKTESLKEKTEGKKDQNKPSLQKSEQQSSGDVYYSKQSKKEHKDSNQNKVQSKEEASDFDDQVSQAKEEDSEQSDEVIEPKQIHKSPKRSTEQKQKSSVQSHEQSKYSFTLLLTFCLYSLIIFMVIVTIKCTNTSSKAAKAVNVMIDAVGDMFKKKQGYRPALNEEQLTDREEQITIGYKVEDNKQIFWEKNSVQGI